VQVEQVRYLELVAVAAQEDTELALEHLVAVRALNPL
jgi:hypothetical protein